MEKIRFSTEEHRETAQKLNKIEGDAQAVYLALREAYPAGGDVMQKADQLLWRMSESMYPLKVGLCIEDSPATGLCFWNSDLGDIYFPGIEEWAAQRDSQQQTNNQGT